MNVDELKKKLKSYELHFSELCRAKAEIEILKNEKAGILHGGKSTNDNDGMPRGTTTSDATFDKVVRMIELDKKIERWEKEAERHEKKISEIEKFVSTIADERQRYCVWEFYCKGRKMPIAGRCEPTTGLAKRQIQYILEKAIAELATINM